MNWESIDWIDAMLKTARRGHLIYPIVVLLMTACTQQSHFPTESGSSLPINSTASPSPTDTTAINPTTELLPSAPAQVAVVPVIATMPVISIDAGTFHGLALRMDGEVWAWGAADILGFSSELEASQAVPILLPNAHNIKSIYTDGLWSLFIDETGHLYELSFIDRGKYALVSGIDEVKQVATGAGRTLIVLADDGSLRAWGEGEKGQLGVQDLTSTSTFVSIPLTDVTQIAFSRDLALAVRSDGSLWAWGRDEEVTGTEEIWSTPQQVSELQNVDSVAKGDGLNILHKDGTVTVWLQGEFYVVENVPAIVQIDGSLFSYNLGVAADGTLWTWGSLWPNALYGELDDRDDLPDSDYDRIFGPERFQGHEIGLENVIQVTADGSIIFALDKHGTVWSWGHSRQGSGGTGLEEGSITEPTPIIIQEP